MLHGQYLQNKKPDASDEKGAEIITARSAARYSPSGLRGQPSGCLLVYRDIYCERRVSAPARYTCKPIDSP